ncbi:glycosyl transferase [Brumimicrobium salinarum]|uniref:Glycosyl transferase n=1 Tax=Brumimicrobium salinarum TaxID=2058658 RepID=A0A2I0R4E4_9FLAO|nr:glycosyltransferase family 2 protein [Brumimicrobium salinarum]PKR81454.1 glycosyl transferase [Brumimicrobium salinarum]
MKKLSILIPVYNEESTVVKLLKNVLSVDLVHNIQKEIIIVNDASTDKTRHNIQSFIDANPNHGIQFYSQEENQGKGSALALAIQKCTGDYLVFQDADLELDPNDINLLIKPVIMAEADVVFGSRFIGSQPRRILFYWHSFGNRTLTFFSNVLNNLTLTDMATCYKLIRTSIAKDIKIKEKRFGIDPEMTAKLAKVPNVKIYEVGISYYARNFGEGKKIGWKDGFRAVWCILKYRFVN